MASSKCSKQTIVGNEDMDLVVTQTTRPPSQQLDYAEVRPIKIDIEKKSKPSAVHNRLMGIKRLSEEKDGGNHSRRSSMDEGRG